MPVRLTQYRIACAVERPVTIGLVADLHEYAPEPVLELLQRMQPDVIAAAGDLLERHSCGENLDRLDRSLTSRMVCAGIRGIEWITGPWQQPSDRVNSENTYRFFRQAGAIAPVVLCRGNHERYLTEQDRAVMAGVGVHLLENASVELLGIRFGGLVSRQVTGGFDRGFLEEFSAAPGFKILLNHHPEDYPDLAPYGPDLILSGHCHGGQIRLFGRGLFAPGQGILPRYHHGIYHGRLVVSAGCANTAPFPRWGNEPEVVQLVLEPDGGIFAQKMPINS